MNRSPSQPSACLRIQSGPSSSSSFSSSCPEVPKSRTRTRTRRKPQRPLILSLIAAAGLVATYLHAADDILIADFEGTNYGNWKVTGEAFGPGPARGTLPGQMQVDGFQGKG